MFLLFDRMAKVPSSRPSTGLSASSMASEERRIIAARTVKYTQHKRPIHIHY